MARHYLRNMLFEDDDIDEEYEEFLRIRIEEEESIADKNTIKCRRGSIMGRDTIEKDLMEGHERLYHDYYANRPKYGARYFRGRFRMKRDLFFTIHDAVVGHDSYFVKKRNADGRLGLSSLQKVTSVFRMLAYGVPTDYIYEYVQIGKGTTIESFRHFIVAVVEVFGDEYLRSPNRDDLNRLLAKGEERGFPGMLGTIDCMHWTWKNCPTAWHGMYTGHIREPTIILEVVASYDLWIWHAFFGLPGSLNDINVLERSFVFNELAEGCAPPISYVVNGTTYNMRYYLADGACFWSVATTFCDCSRPNEILGKDTLKYIMTTCIIMHNMIVEDERDERRSRQSQVRDFGKEYDQVDDVPKISFSLERTPTLMEFIENHRRIKDKQIHTQLQEDLIEHLWKIHGGQ